MEPERRTDPPVRAVMAPLLFAVSTEDAIDKVAAELERHRLFVAPVVNEDGSVFGVISAYAIAHVLATRQNPRAIRAWELCAYQSPAVPHDTPLSVAAKLMAVKRLQYTVVKDGARVVGILSSFDFVEHYAREQPAEAR